MAITTTATGDARVRLFVRLYQSGRATRDDLAAEGIDPDALPSRGLGDTVAKFTRATGLDKVAKAVERVTGKPCGCAERQKRLNAAVPYSAQSPSAETSPSRKTGT